MYGRTNSDVQYSKRSQSVGVLQRVHITHHSRQPTQRAGEGQAVLYVMQ